MNQNVRRIAAVSAIALATTLAAVAPAAAQSKASAKSVDSLNSVLKEVQKGRDQVQGAMDSLKALSSGGEANLTKNYKAFSKSVADLNKTKETASARAADMKERREAYLQEWQEQSKSVSNPEIQAHMQARAEELKKLFESLQPAGDALKQAFPPFLSDLNDIQKLLSLDLSQSGMASAAPIAEKAVTNGNTILESFDTYLTTLTGIRDKVSPKAAK